MRTLLCCVLAVGAVLHVAGCGDGGGPTASTPPSNPSALSFQPVRIVSGADRRPVPGAQVLLDGVGHVSNAEGEVIPAPGSYGAPTGVDVDVDAAGFLPRRTRVPPDRLITLWPVAGESEADAVREMVYGGPRGTILLPTVFNLFSLSFSFESGTAISSSGLKQVWYDEAAAFGAPFGLTYEEGAAIPYETDYLIAVRFSEAGGCRTVPAWGSCQEAASGDYTAFKVLPEKAGDPATVRRVLASWFLGPNPLPGLLNPDAPAAELSPLEVQTIRMILQRPNPNRWPDTDR
jgi:hypothetical protein